MNREGTGGKEKGEFNKNTSAGLKFLNNCLRQAWRLMCVTPLLRQRHIDLIDSLANQSRAVSSRLS